MLFCCLLFSLSILFTELGDEEAKGELCKTKQVRGKKVMYYIMIIDLSSVGVTLHSMDFHHR